MRLILLTLFVTSCGTGRADPPKASTAGADPWGRPAPPQPNAPEILARYADFTQRVCQCTDNDCLERVTDERNRYGYELKKKYGEGSLSAAHEAKALQLRDEYAKCVVRIAKRDPNRPRASEETVVRRMAEFRDEMCGCSDRRCIDRVRTAMAQHLESVAHMPLDDNESARLQIIADETMKCGVRPLPP